MPPTFRESLIRRYMRMGEAERIQLRNDLDLIDTALAMAGPRVAAGSQAAQPENRREAVG